MEFGRIGDKEATRLRRAAGGSAKLAIVIAHLTVWLTASRQGLKSASGSLTQLLNQAAGVAAARHQLTALATWLERNGHADAAASVREGLEETLTVLKLGLPPALRRFFATTNCIENLIGTLRHVTRNIKR